MYIHKTLFGINFIVRIQSLQLLTLVNIAYDRFLSCNLTVCILNLRLTISYTTEKQRRMFEELSKNVHNVPWD